MQRLIRTFHLAVCLLLLSISGWAISKVGSRVDTSTIQNAVTTITTGTMNAAAGNFVTCVVRYGPGSLTSVSGVQDNATTPNVLTSMAAVNSGSDFVQIWYGNIVTANAADAFTFTFTPAGGGNNTIGACDQWSGIATSSPLDTTASATGTQASGAALTSSAFTTAQAS